MKTNQTLARPDVDLSFRDLLLYVLIRWKVIVICALVCAVLAGCYKFYKDTEVQKASLSASYSEKDEQAAALAVSYDKNVKSLKAYCAESYLMQVDCTNAYTANLLFAVTGENSNVIASLYGSLAKEQTVLAQVAAENEGIATAGLEELVLTTVSSGENSASGSSNSCVLTVQVVAPTEGIRDSFAKAIGEYLPTQTSGVRKAAGAHAFALVSSETTVAPNEVIRDKQQKARTALENAANALTTVEKKLGGNALEYYKYQTTNASTPNAKVTVSKKYVAVGFAAGLFVSLACIVVVYLLRRRIKSAEDTECNFNVSVLGTYGNARAPKWVKKLLSIETKQTEEQLALISCKLSLITADYGEGDYLYITSSTVSDENMQLLAAQCDKVRILPTPQNDVASLRQLSEAKNIILAETVGKTPYRQLHSLLQVCLQFGQPEALSGVILFQ